MHQSLGLDLAAAGGARPHLLRAQNADGSWGIATARDGDVSTTAEVVLALRILGVASTTRRMKAADALRAAQGGLETMRVFTRISFAMFGLFPWSAVPTMSPEFILCRPSRR